MNGNVGWQVHHVYMHIMNYYMHSILYLGLGEHRLKEEFLAASISPDEIEIMENISLEDIVKRVKDGADFHEYTEPHEFMKTGYGFSKLYMYFLLLVF